jgi:hypothetical protein
MGSVLENKAMEQELEVKELRAIHDLLIVTAKKAGEMITSAKPSTGDTGSKKNCETKHFHIPFLYSQDLNMTKDFFMNSSSSIHFLS